MFRPAKLSMPEFIALMALTFSLLAFSIDSMLPAFPEIADDLTPDFPNRAQLILSFFMLGMGAGMLVNGPLSDAVGRIPVITGGIVVYIIGALIAWHAPNMEMLLAGRMVQGLGASAPRVIGNAMIRDLYEGRRMAQITSFVMTVFMIVPAMAPSVGQLVIASAGWRAMFPVYICLAVVVAIWLNLRQRETLPPERRRPFTPTVIWSGTREVLTNRLVLRYILVLVFGFSQHFALIGSIQPIYDVHFGLGDEFPLAFMATAAISAAGTVVNAALVMRLGMRKLAQVAYGVLSVAALAVLVLSLSGIVPKGIEFAMFFAWTTIMFFFVGLTFGNLNALAIQPLGHIAGLAASLISAIFTIGAAILGAAVSLAFDGTPNPVYAGALVFSTLAWLVMRTTSDAPPSPQS